MTRHAKYILFIPITVTAFFPSCSTIEKSSTHGFDSGYYKLKSDQNEIQNVYVDIVDEQIDVYHETDKQPDSVAFQSISLKPTNGYLTNPLVFRKNSFDLDITAILLKYRSPIYGIPGQLNTDFNVALYAGWRHDSYTLKKQTDPLGKSYHRISSWGYDFGFFSGPGSTQISPSTTQNLRPDEYSGFIIQAGFAGFLESNIASFGLSLGMDYLMNSDRTIWIYNKKPWIGFIVGIALN